MSHTTPLQIQNPDPRNLFQFIITPRSNIEGARNGTSNEINATFKHLIEGRYLVLHCMVVFEQQLLHLNTSFLESINCHDHTMLLHNELSNSFNTPHDQHYTVETDTTSDQAAPKLLLQIFPGNYIVSKTLNIINFMQLLPLLYLWYLCLSSQ